MSFQTINKIVSIAVTGLLFNLCLLFVFSCGKSNNTPNYESNIIIVDNKPGNFDEGKYQDVNTAIDSATENTKIFIGEGTYIVDNPIIIKQKRVRIIGSSKEKTILFPKNVGEPVFMFAANYLGIENIGIDAEIEDKYGRATFAILIEEGYGNCEMKNMIIQNTGASSIIGHSVNDCTVDNNIIINSGDDAIQLRGPRLKVFNNVLLDYFDEGIDIAGGENIIVSNNLVSSGRIGIVVDNSKNSLIYGNIVEDQLQEGIVFGSELGGIVQNNTVHNSVDIAFNLYSPLMVKSNLVVGNHDVGFKIWGMKSGIIQENVMISTDLGIILSESSRNMIVANKLYGGNELIKIKEDSAENYLQGNVSHEKYEESEIQKLIRNKKHQIPASTHRVIQAEKRSYDKYNINSKLVPEALFESEEEISGSDTYDIEIKGESERDKNIAESIANFLGNNNPGYLSVEIRGNSMTSHITQDMFNSLKGGNQLSVGLVRVPYLMFKDSTEGDFPLWHLFSGNEQVAIVSYMTTGANVKIYLFENNVLDLWSRLSLWKDGFIARMEFYKTKFLSKIN